MRKSALRFAPAVALIAALGSGGWMASQASDDNTGGYRTGTMGAREWDPRTGRAGMMGAGMMGAGMNGAGMNGAGMNGAGMRGAGMMSGGRSWGWLSGDGKPVRDLEQARERAQRFAAQLDADVAVGEVMQFAENYYAELEGAGGVLVTEVLIDPGTGAVQVEHGPAMMWNRRYGMMNAPSAGKELTPEKARIVAAEWAQDRGLSVGEADALPGYYTLHTLRKGKVDGMVSVNAATGQVWYHDWHGEFVDMAERP